MEEPQHPGNFRKVCDLSVKTIDEITATLGLLSESDVDSLADDCKAKAARLSAACDAYNADIAERRANMEKRAAEYEQQLEDLAKNRAHYEAQVSKLTGSGDIDAAAQADERLAAVNAHIANLERKRRLADPAALKGDADLYAECEAANAEYTAALQAWREAISAAWADIKHEAQRLETLAESTYSKSTSQPGYGAAYSYRQISDHFNETEKKREAAALQRKAQADTDKDRAPWQFSNGSTHNSMLWS